MFRCFLYISQSTFNKNEFSFTVENKAQVVSAFESNNWHIFSCAEIFSHFKITFFKLIATFSRFLKETTKLFAKEEEKYSCYYISWHDMRNNSDFSAGYQIWNFYNRLENILVFLSIKFSIHVKMYLECNFENLYMKNIFINS